MTQTMRQSWKIDDFPQRPQPPVTRIISNILIIINVIIIITFVLGSEDPEGKKLKLKTILGGLPINYFIRHRKNVFESDWVETLKCHWQSVKQKYTFTSVAWNLRKTLAKIVEEVIADALIATKSSNARSWNKYVWVESAYLASFFSAAISSMLLTAEEEAEI